MSKSEYKKRFYPYTFLLIYFLLGATWLFLYLHAAISANINLNSMNDALLGIFLILPTLLAATAFMTLVSSQAINAVLWNCSLFWIFLSVGELMKKGVLIPAPFPIYGAAIVSASCIAYLVFSQLRKFRLSYQPPREHSTVCSIKYAAPHHFARTGKGHHIQNLAGQQITFNDPGLFICQFHHHNICKFNPDLLFWTHTHKDI